MAPPKPPRLSAVYVPGGHDDISMPEVVSPSPQRIMPEVPTNMQEDLANLELEANNLHNKNNSAIFALNSPPHARGDTRLKPVKSSDPGYEHTNGSIYQNIKIDDKQTIHNESLRSSPFPKVQNPGPHVPLSDEEKGELLERTRHQVLKSTDPEVQLAWAQDALSWVEVESEYASRIAAEGQSARVKTPKIELQLREDAINIIRHLGEQGHPKAEFMRACSHEFGKFGYRLDKKEAFMGYMRAAEKGYSRAQYRIGMQYENSNNLVKAIEHYRKGITMKDSASHYRLGMMTLLGQHGTPLDYEYGINLVRFAAETADENSPQGAYVYGMIIARDLPNINIPDQYLPSDINEARFYIEKSAYLGFGKAQLKMGMAYELCQLGCEFDPSLSLHYNSLASRQGEAAADMAISKWFLCGFEGIFDKNEELAFIYAKRAAVTKFPVAEFAIGYFYEIGMYVSIDLRESEMWYQRAAEHGNTDALGRIKSIKANNTFSKNDHEQIAIKRIKSQYGSQIGVRPDRFKKQPPSPAVTGTERTNTLDARHSYGGPAIPRKEPLDSRNSYSSPVVRTDVADSRNSYPGPARSESYVPKNTYNPSARPHRTSNVPPNAPMSVLPYPKDDAQNTAYGQGARLLPNFGPQSDRPHSAFGIRPRIHTNTDKFGQGQDMRSYGEVRPSTSMSTVLHHNSRGNSSGIGDRIVSAGGDPPHMSYRSPTSPPGRSHDFNADGSCQTRLQSLTSAQNQNKPRPSPHSEDYHARQHVHNHNPVPARPDSTGNSFIRPDRTSSSNPSPAQQNPSRLSQRPPQRTSSSQQVAQPQKETRVDPRPLPSPPVTSPSNSGPKKTGPATFEEMGIPAANKEGDCMPPRKHKLDAEDDLDATSLSPSKLKADKTKVVKTKAEKKTKIEKPRKEKSDLEKPEKTKKEKPEGRRVECAAIPKFGKDGKEKVMAINGPEAMDLIIEYLKEQNRPYSATEISANLHGKVAKTVADKLLKEMAESGKINSKSTKGNEKGSQWVFWALQDVADNASPEELAIMDDTIKAMKELMPKLKSQLKETTKNLENLRSTPTTANLVESIGRLREEIKEKRDLLDRCSNEGDNTKVTREDMMRVEKDLKYWTTKRAARKRAFQALEDLFLENKPRGELWEEAGIEADTY